jgi:hypothetical protein
MIRRAEWRRLPKDPRTPMGWILHESRGVAGVLAINFGFFWLGAVLAASSRYPLTTVVFFAAPCLFLYPILRTQGLMRLGSISELAAVPEPAKTFPIEFSLHREGICTGIDRGIATIVGGWLHVEGLHTTFSIRPVDIIGISSQRGSKGGLVLADDQTVRITSLKRSLEDREVFGETLRSWRHFPFELPQGEPLMPPIRVHGSAISRPLFAMLVSVAAASGVLGVLIWLFLSGNSELLAGPLFTIALLLAYTFSLAGAQMTNFYRLRALERKALAESAQT